MSEKEKITVSKNIILVAEDDDDDYLLIRDSLRMAKVYTPIHRVKDGQELMDYLLAEGQYHDQEEVQIPDLIFLDMKMPRKNGLEALAEIKTHPHLQKIPIIVLSLLEDQKKVVQAYELGADSYINKPATFVAFVEAMKEVKKNWLREK